MNLLTKVRQKRLFAAQIILAAIVMASIVVPLLRLTISQHQAISVFTRLSEERNSITTLTLELHNSLKQLQTELLNWSKDSSPTTLRFYYKDLDRKISNLLSKSLELSLPDREAIRKISAFLDATQKLESPDVKIGSAEVARIASDLQAVVDPLESLIFDTEKTIYDSIALRRGILEQQNKELLYATISVVIGVLAGILWIFFLRSSYYRSLKNLEYTNGKLRATNIEMELKQEKMMILLSKVFNILDQHLVDVHGNKNASVSMRHIVADMKTIVGKDTKSLQLTPVQLDVYSIIESWLAESRCHAKTSVPKDTFLHGDAKVFRDLLTDIARIAAYSTNKAPGEITIELHGKQAHQRTISIECALPCLPPMTAAAEIDRFLDIKNDSPVDSLLGTLIEVMIANVGHLGGETHTTKKSDTTVLYIEIPLSANVPLGEPAGFADSRFAEAFPLVLVCMPASTVSKINTYLEGSGLAMHGFGSHDVESITLDEYNGAVIDYYGDDKGKSGIEIAQIMKARNFAAPIWIATGIGEEEDAVIEQGFKALKKPIKASALVPMTKDFLAQAALRRQSKD